MQGRHGVEILRAQSNSRNGMAEVGLDIDLGHSSFPKAGKISSVKDHWVFRLASGYHFLDFL